MLKETETLELKQRLLNSVNVQFDYYPINCREIQKTPNAIHSIYRGNVNRPNIILNNNQYFPTYYQTSELAIYSKLHEGSHQAELVIKHTPISNSIIPVYLCFFVYSNSNSSSETNVENINTQSVVESLNIFIQSTNPLDIDISPLLTPYDFTKTIEKELPITWQIYETVNSSGNCMVILINKPVYINSILINQIPQNKTPPFKILNTSIKIDKSIETFVTVKNNDVSGYAFSINSDDNEMTCEMIPNTEYGEINVAQMPLQLGKDSTDRLFIINIIVYTCIAIVIVLIEILFSTYIFDFILNKLVSVKTYEKVRNVLILWVCVFTIITIFCLGFGISGKTGSSNNVLVTTVGLFFLVSTIITTGSLYYTNDNVKNFIINPAGAGGGGAGGGAGGGGAGGGGAVVP